MQIRGLFLEIGSRFQIFLQTQNSIYLWVFFQARKWILKNLLMIKKINKFQVNRIFQVKVNKFINDKKNLPIYKTYTKIEWLRISVVFMYSEGKG